MKTLYESILDDEEEVMDRMSQEVIEKCEQEALNFFNWHSNARVKIVKKDQLPIEVDIAAYAASHTVNIEKELPENVVIRKCVGNLEVGNKVKSLKGFPKKIDGSFSCGRNVELTNLKDGPKIVTGDYTCTFMPNLTSLEGCPTKCNNFYCGSCPKLKNLKGGPKEVKLNYNCSGCENLESLEGIAKKVGWNLFLSDCKKLKDIKDVPKYIPGYLILAGSGLEKEDFEKYCKGILK